MTGWPDVHLARQAVADTITAATGLPAALDPAGMVLPGVLVDVPSTVAAAALDNRTVTAEMPVWLLTPPAQASGWAWVGAHLAPVMAALGAATAQAGAYLWGDTEIPGHQITVNVTVRAEPDPTPLDQPEEL